MTSIAPLNSPEKTTQQPEHLFLVHHFWDYDKYGNIENVIAPGSQQDSKRQFLVALENK